MRELAIIAVLFGAPAIALLAIQRSYNKNIEQARNAPSAAGDHARGIVVIEGRVSARTPVLRNGWVAYREIYQSRRTRQDGSDVYESRYRVVKQPLWLDTPQGQIRVEGDYELSGDFVRSEDAPGCSGIPAGARMTVMGVWNGAAVVARVAHAGNREGLVLVMRTRMGGSAAYRVIAILLLLVGVWLTIANLPSQTQRRIENWIGRMTKMEDAQAANRAAWKTARGALLEKLAAGDLNAAQAVAANMHRLMQPGDDYALVGTELAGLAEEAERQGLAAAASWLNAYAADEYEEYPDHWDKVRYEHRVIELRRRAEALANS